MTIIRIQHMHNPSDGMIKMCVRCVVANLTESVNGVPKIVQVASMFCKKVMQHYTLSQSKSDVENRKTLLKFV